MHHTYKYVDRFNKNWIKQKNSVQKFTNCLLYNEPFI